MFRYRSVDIIACPNRVSIQRVCNSTSYKVCFDVKYIHIYVRKAWALSLVLAPRCLVICCVVRSKVNLI
jgi:hypothetical protein